MGQTHRQTHTQTPVLEMLTHLKICIVFPSTGPSGYGPVHQITGPAEIIRKSRPGPFFRISFQAELFRLKYCLYSPTTCAV